MYKKSFFRLFVLTIFLFLGAMPMVLCGQIGGVSSSSNSNVPYTVGEIKVNGLSGSLGSTVITITLTDLVDVVDLNTSDDISVSPNPVSNFINIKSRNSLESRLISVIDINGNLVKSFSYRKKIDLSQLASGTYILSIDGMKAVKVIKI